MCNYVTKLNAGSPTPFVRPTRSWQEPGFQMASLTFIQGWYARLFSNTYGENVISIWRGWSLPSVISTSLQQHKMTASNCWHYCCLFALVYTTTCLCSHPTSPLGMPGARCLGCDQFFTRIDRHWGQNAVCQSIHYERIQTRNNTLFPGYSSSEGSSSSSLSSSFDSDVLEPCIESGFVGSLICLKQQPVGEAFEPIACSRNSDMIELFCSTQR